MAEYTIVQVRRDSTLNWYASNPRLALGEPGVDMDLHRFKIGNGIDRWNELPYMDDDLYRRLDTQQQTTADKIQDLLNKIAANKLDADQKYNALTSEVRNTSRDLTGRMTAVETEQQEYQENLTERQQEFEEAVTGDFEDTKAEVQAGLDEFNESRDKLNIRMDAIVGQATEDTEILDARVDADYQTHPTLGANIRNIHIQLKTAEQARAEKNLALDEGISSLKDTREEHTAELLRLSDGEKKQNIRDEFLQKQIEDNAQGVIGLGLELYSEQQDRRQEDIELSDRLDAENAGREEEERRLWEVVNTAIDETSSDIESLNIRLCKEQQIRQEKDTAHDAENEAFGDALRHERERLQIEIDRARSQEDTISEAVLGGTFEHVREHEEREKAEQKLSDHITGNDERLHEEAHTRSIENAKLREQIKPIAEGLMLEGLNRYEADSRLQSRLEHEETTRTSWEDSQNEQINDLAVASVQQSVNVRNEVERRRRDIQRVNERLDSSIEKTQAQLSKASEASLGNALNVFYEFVKRRELEQQLSEYQQNTTDHIQELERSDLTEARIRASNDAGLQEQIEILAILKLREALDRYEEHIRAKADKQHNDTATQEDRQKQIDQINNLTEAVLREALDRCEEHLQAKADKQHIDAAIQELDQYQTEQINDLSSAVLYTLINGYRAREKIIARLIGLENALVDVGVLDDNYAPVTTDAEIDDMIEDIFSGNAPSEPIIPDSDDEAEFLENIHNIFNP